MKTLVYFASGPNREEYQELGFDKIYLVDNCFRNAYQNSERIFSEGNVTCIGMDCLESIQYLKRNGIQIDYFVSLNEGLYEGGGRYALNSDMFLGYVMTLFKPRYIHIMNKNYYHGIYHVTMDVPYIIEELEEDDPRYLNPCLFSKDSYHQGVAKVFQMTKQITKDVKLEINSSITVKIIHDSIWNYYEEIDALVISFSQQGQEDFFDRIPKVLNMNRMHIDEIFSYCKNRKIKRIGFTPWGKGNYIDFLSKLKMEVGEYPQEIFLFHLNRNDYKGIKEYKVS
jgi:hypothetical protein